MTRRLILLRHAKAASTGAVDRQRPLARRGKADAAAVGRWLAERELVPARAVVSPARRAQQTWQLAAAELTDPPKPVTDERIYDNAVEALLAIVRETSNDVETVALVGHNPSTEAFAAALDDGQGDTAGRREMAEKYPTSGVAVFSIAGPWAEVDAGTGTLETFAAPRG